LTHTPLEERRDTVQVETPSAESNQARLFGPAGGPEIGTIAYHLCRRIAVSTASAQNVSPVPQSTGRVALAWCSGLLLFSVVLATSLYRRRNSR
jgi:hypothetical protein